MEFWVFTLKDVLRICLHKNHVKKDEMKCSRTVLVFTLTSSTISKCNKIHKFYFFKNHHLLKWFDLCKQKIKRIPGPLGTERFEFFLKIEAKKKVGGVSLLFKLCWMNFTFLNSTVRPCLWYKHFWEKYNIKSHSLSGSRMVGEAFLKSLSTAGFWVR